MHNARFLSFSTLLSLLFVVAGALGSPGPDGSQDRRAANSRLRGWGITAQIDKAFYAVGDRMHAESILSNRTGADAYGWAPVRGGNGCDYDFRIVQPGGEVVWEPGSIINNQFSGPGCSFGAIGKTLLRGGKLVNQVELDLIYQNRGGVGVLGAPLVPGAYELHVEIYFGGPSRTSPVGMPGGGCFTATVPFLIE